MINFPHDAFCGVIANFISEQDAIHEMISSSVLVLCLLHTNSRREVNPKYGHFIHVCGPYYLSNIKDNIVQKTNGSILTFIAGELGQFTDNKQNESLGKYNRIRPEVAQYYKA